MVSIMHTLNKDDLKTVAFNKIKNNEKYLNRLKIEFEEIEKSGLWEYFYNIILSGKKFHNTRNLLCCYLWGICPENPIEEDLIWEQSNEMPDLDIDFQPEARNHIKKYCSEAFGEENVVSIANYNHFGIKSGIRDISRVMEVPLQEVNACTTKMGDDVNRINSWEKAAETYPVLSDFEKKYPEVCKLVKQFNGRVRSLGMHAGGVVIASCNLTKTIPLITRTDPKTKEKMILSSFAEGQARSDLKSVGLVKQDFLGLENLNYISTCLKLMQQRKKYDPNVGIFRASPDEEDWTDESYLNDQKCIETANRGDLQLVFQFDSDGMRKLIKKGGVTSFDDLVAYTSIFRPGPFEHFADKYCDRKQGKEKYELHKVLESIIGNTYGCVCIAKGSKVVIKNGYKNIENIKINDLVLTEDGTYQKVLKVINNGIKQTLKIRCSNGEELSCTPDHKILTNEGWKKAEDLYKNDLIKSFWISNQNKINIQSDFDWLIGLILADGHMSENNNVTICCSDEIFANETANIAKKIFPDLNPRVKLITYSNTSSCWQCCLVHTRSEYSSKNPLIEYLREIKIWGLTKDNKKFPKKISLSMIAGILEGNADIKTRTIKLRNKNLSYELFKALQSYRINSSYFEEIEPQFNKKLYCVTFHDYKHIIPFKIKKDSFTRNSKTKFISEYIDNYEHDHWSKVLSIKNDIKREVYDLSVDKNHSYVVGGLVVHNCYQEQLMQIMNKVGLISLQNVDNIRRAMAKKKEKEFTKFKPEFIEGGCRSLGWEKEKVEDLWNQMINFASYGFNKCITPDTIVETENSNKLAGECNPGDIIKSYNTETKELFLDEVIQLHNNGIKDVYEIELENEYKIKCTLDHEFVCENGKKIRLEDIIKNNNKILCNNSKISACKIIKITYLGKQKVIDLEMKSKFHNFIANGMVVGNSHALAYTMVSSRCLYLKTYYPEEYFTAVLSHLKTGDDRIKIYIQEGLRKGIEFTKVDINNSKTGYTIIGNKIYIGFNKIKGINKESEEIIKMQPFSSFEDYIERFGLSKKTGETLVSCGAFDRFNTNTNLLLKYFEYRKDIGNKDKGMNRIEFGKMYKELTNSKSCPRDLSLEFSKLLKENETKIPYAKLVKLALTGKFNFTNINKNKIIEYIELNKSKFKHTILSLSEFEHNRKINNKEIYDLSHIDKCKLKYEFYGFYIPDHPLDNTRSEGLEIRNVIYSDSSGTIEGMISKIKKKQTRNGNTYYEILIEDRLDSVNVVLWGDQVGRYRHLIHEYAFIKIDITPSIYSSWNLSKNGKIERIRTLDEMSEQEEIEMQSAQKHSNLINLLKERSINE